MKTIAIVAGGDSPEYGISIKSAVEVKKSLEGRFNSYIIVIKGINWYWEDEKGRYHSIDKNTFTLKTDDHLIRFDAVFNAIHGKPGENGQLQGYFDMLGLPYTSCGAFCSALTFNKQACKLWLKEYGIRMAEAILIRKGSTPDRDAILTKTGLPCFIKPNDSGSSFGVSKVKTAEEFQPALEKAFAESNEALVEAFMDGREVACGVVKTRSRSLVLPVTEIVSKKEFFDYEAKYTPGWSDEITPAQLPDDVYREVQDLSSYIYDLLGCKGIVRTDFIITRGRPFFLEINTIPGMTMESIVPKQAAAAGIEPGELYSMVIEDVLG